jgi:hypothetical protein
MPDCELDGPTWAQARGNDKPTPIKGYIPVGTYYYKLQEVGKSVESSSTLGENPNQTIRCLTNDTWSDYLPGSYINFMGSKFKANDKNCFDADITKEICTLILPKNPSNPQPISEDGGSHYTINGTSFYGEDTKIVGDFGRLITQDGRAFYTALDKVNIIEIVFMTNDDGKLKGSVEGNKLRTVFVHAIAPEKKPEPRRNFSGRLFGALFE